MPRNAIKKESLPIISLTDNQAAYVDACANRDGISKAAVMRQAVTMLLKDYSVDPAGVGTALKEASHAGAKPFTNVYLDPEPAQQFRNLCDSFKVSIGAAVRVGIDRLMKGA